MKLYRLVLDYLIRMKTYCWMFYSRQKQQHMFEYFNTLEEVQNFINDYSDLELLSLQRIFKI